MLDVKEQKVADHLKEFRPKQYRELVQSGQLKLQVQRMWEDYTSQLHDLTMNQGLAYDQAQEKLREVAFPPPESAQPLLGENPAFVDPTSVETTS